MVAHVKPITSIYKLGFRPNKGDICTFETEQDTAINGEVTRATNAEATLQSEIQAIGSPWNYAAGGAALAATTAALAANTYANGSSGVGATLTGNANGAIGAQDGVALIVGSRLLVWKEAAAAHNGLYVVTQLGDGSHPYILTRANDADSAAELGGMLVVIGGGVTYGGRVLLLPISASSIVIGTTALNFDLAAANSNFPPALASTAILLTTYPGGYLIPDGTVIQTYGRSTLADGGGAPFRFVAADTSTADNGGTIRVDGGGRRWYYVGAPATYVAELWGADPTGIADSTAVLQAAINFIVTIAGQELVLGGQYLISDALHIPFGTGWKIRGRARASCGITQNANNKPIFSLAQNLTHSWAITDLNLNWTTPQTSADTTSCGFWFTGGSGCFNFQIERITFNNGFRSISNDVTANVSNWGAYIHSCVHGGSMTGGFYFGGQATPNGQPNIKIDGVYINAASMDASEPVISIYTSDSFSLDNVEVNEIVNNNQLLNISSSHGSIGSIKLELATYTAAKSIIFIADSHVSIAQLTLETLTIDASGDHVFGINQSGGSVTLDIGQCILSFAVPIVGAFYLSNIGSPPNYTCRFRSAPQGLIGEAGAYLTWAAGSTALDATSVDEWLQPRLSADIGDADASWAIGADPGNVIQALTTLTANRTVTLTDAANGGDSNLIDGVIVRVVRNAGPPGAFNLAVNNAAGANIGNLPSTNGVLEFMFQRFAWRLINKSEWTGTGT